MYRSVYFSGAGRVCKGLSLLVGVCNSQDSQPRNIFKYCLKHCSCSLLQQSGKLQHQFRLTVFLCHAWVMA